jgi:four helix bundle protein
MAEGSLEEIKCQTMLAKDLGYLDINNYQRIFELQEEAGKLLWTWISRQR